MSHKQTQAFFSANLMIDSWNMNPKQPLYYKRHDICFTNLFHRFVLFLLSILLFITFIILCKQCDSFYTACKFHIYCISLSQCVLRLSKWNSYGRAYGTTTVIWYSHCLRTEFLLWKLFVLTQICKGENSFKQYDKLIISILSPTINTWQNVCSTESENGTLFLNTCTWITDIQNKSYIEFDTDNIMYSSGFSTWYAVTL